MAKKDWQTCTDPVRMIRAFRNQASERRLRLLVCGLARKAWNGPADDRSRKAVEVAELFADGEATPRELSSARNGAGKAYAVATFNTRVGAELAYLSTQVATNVTEASSRKAIRFAAQFAAQIVPQTTLVELLRCVCGALIYHPTPLDPVLRTWHDSLLVSMARRMYDARGFADLPILADALEDAGCTNADILTHCRQPGEHVRGCWVVDLLLGKK
jgi:hypothetical protein